VIHKFKAIGTAVVAVLAVNAVMASAAVAEGSYTASKYPTTVTGVSALGNSVFTTEGGTAECVTHYEAAVTEPSSQLTTKSLISNCKAFGFVTATVTMGSCDHLFTTPTNTGTPGQWTVKIHVKCTNPAEPMWIIAANCELTVGEQSPGGHVIITNTAGEVDVQATVTGINYTVIKDGFLCPFAGTGAKTGATYKHQKAVNFKATNGASVDIG